MVFFLWSGFGKKPRRQAPFASVRQEITQYSKGKRVSRGRKPHGFLPLVWVRKKAPPPGAFRIGSPGNNPVFKRERRCPEEENRSVFLLWYGFGKKG